jgi:divalent metal cation (Fe/Co/Zn/Cd) transporter
MSDFIQIGPPPVSGTGACSPSALVTRGVIRLQVVTLVWMLIECGLSLYSAKAACSPALFAFGSDSFVELLSASVVLLQFLPAFPLSRRVATRAAGILLFALAAIVGITAIFALTYGAKPETSLLGIAVTIAALLAMPILAWKKRQLSRQTNDRALAADAVQSATCAYLAAITLAGLTINALLHIHWVDSAAALLAIPILVVEGTRAMRGETCGCC